MVGIWASSSLFLTKKNVESVKCRVGYEFRLRACWELSARLHLFILVARRAMSGTGPVSSCSSCCGAGDLLGVWLDDFLVRTF